MTPTQNSLLGVLVAIALAATPARAEEPRPSPDDCEFATGEDRTVTHALDGETLGLDGGTRVLLIGALAPRSYDAAGETTHWPLAQQARTELERLVVGRSVRLAFAGRRTDRHGRLLAHVFVGPEPSSTWVQGEMLKRGLARAYALDGNTQCLTELIAHEALARASRTGLWSETIYAVRSAEEISPLLRLTGTFQIVEGRVVAVSTIRGSTYINFGLDWRRDFTVLVPEMEKRAAAALKADALAGRTLRVRGWIERRGGPLIAIHHPAEIEVLALDERGTTAVAQPPAASTPRE